MDERLIFPIRLDDAERDGFGIGCWRSSDAARTASLWLERTPIGFIAALSEEGALVIAGFWRKNETRSVHDHEFYFERAWGKMAAKMAAAGLNNADIGTRILDIMGALSLDLDRRKVISFIDVISGAHAWPDLHAARAEACAMPPADLAQAIADSIASARIAPEI